MTIPSTDPTLHLPRILCLHGGGVNSQIFKLQMRSFLTHPSLTSRFRFVFADGPFICGAGPGVHPVYERLGPFRRWTRWLREHEEGEDAVCAAEVLRVCRDAMEEDDRSGANGEWVALLGFSQGAKLVCSLLYEMQVAEEVGGVGGKGDVLGYAGVPVNGEGRTVNGSRSENVRWRFGVVLAGRAPLVALSENTGGFAWCQRAGGMPEEADLDSLLEAPEMKLRVPTVHVHGLKDEGLELHRMLRDGYCAPGTTTLVEWDGNHRVPIKRNDVDKVVDAMLQVAEEYGV